MAGYFGYSMSNNAVSAYESGARPRSKWTKSDIINEVVGNSEWTEVELKKYPAEVIRMAFLRYDSWHHTSSMYNCTDFYRVDADVDRSVVEDIADGYEKPVKRDESITLARVRYGEWTGTRRHMKLIDHEDYAVIKGGWAYLPDGSKKKVSGSHFFTLETYTKAPKGTGKIFSEIKKGVK